MVSRMSHVTNIILVLFKVIVKIQPFNFGPFVAVRVPGQFFKPCFYAEV